MKKWKSKNQPDKDNILGVEVNIHKDCGCMAGQKAELTVPWEIWQKWLAISSSMKNLEWGAVYDVIPLNEGKEPRDITGYMINAFRVPKQVVSGGSCHFEEDLGGNGVVHSHHSMGAFHSAQDDAATRNLFDWSIVLSDKGYEACMRVKMKCGDYTYIPVTLNFTDIPEVKIDNIKEIKPVRTGGYFHGSYDTFNNEHYKGHRINDWPCDLCTGCSEMRTTKTECQEFQDWKNGMK